MVYYAQQKLILSAPYEICWVFSGDDGVMIDLLMQDCMCFSVNVSVLVLYCRQTGPETSFCELNVKY